MISQGDAVAFFAGLRRRFDRARQAVADADGPTAEVDAAQAAATRAADRLEERLAVLRRGAGDDVFARLADVIATFSDAVWQDERSAVDETVTTAATDARRAESLTG